MSNTFPHNFRVPLSSQPNKHRVSQAIAGLDSVLAISISGQAVTACHIVRQGLSKLRLAKGKREIIFQLGTRRSKAFYSRCYERMVAFTNARPQENLPQRFLLRLAPLVLKSECVAKSAKKILLVEDNDEIRELLALFIKHLGYKVFAAARGLEAIHRASVVHPDLIMMDIRMPGMHGDDATACLKANPSTRDIPVLVVTAYGAGIDTRRAVVAGAAEILHKPLDLTTLPNVLHRYLSSRTTKRRSRRKK